MDSRGLESGGPVNRDGHVILLAANARFVHPSWGIRCLKAGLGPLSDRCRLLETTISAPVDEALATVRAAAPRVLGLSLQIWNHRWMKEFLQGLSEDPGPAGWPLVVGGGPLARGVASGDAPDIARYLHVLVEGEGEDVFRTLVEDALAPGAPVVREPPVARACRMVSGGTPCLPGTQALGLYDPEDIRHGRFLYVESSRGCPFSCAFCQSSLEEGVRNRDTEAFLADMEGLIARGGKKFKLLDRTFNADPSRAARILRFFRSRLPEDGMVHVELVPGLFCRELKDVLASFPEGMLRVEIGVQTLDAQVARRVRRAGSAATVESTLAWFRDHTRALVHADLIAGLPGEGMEDFAKGFDRLWALQPGEIQLGLLKRLPGTGICALGPEWAMEFDLLPPWQVRSTSALAGPEVEELGRLARYWELVVNRGHFDGLVRQLLPPGQGAFAAFRAWARDAWSCFGRTHSIPRRELENHLRKWCGLESLGPAPGPRRGHRCADGSRLRGPGS